MVLSCYLDGKNKSVSIGRPRWGTTRCEIHHSMKFRPDPKKSWWLYMILIIDLDLISMILLTYYVLYQLVSSILYRIIYKLDGKVTRWQLWGLALEPGCLRESRRQGWPCQGWRWGHSGFLYKKLRWNFNISFLPMNR